MQVQLIQCALSVLLARDAVLIIHIEILTLLSLRSILHFHTAIASPSCVECSLEINILAYFYFPRRAAGRLHLPLRTSSLRARVCVSH